MRGGLPGACGVGRDECGEEVEAGGGMIGRGGGHFDLKRWTRKRRVVRVSGTRPQWSARRGKKLG